MPDLKDGETQEMKGSAATPYQLKNTGGVYSCTCPAWRNQNHPIERRTCKHLRKLRGDAAEDLRVGSPSPVVNSPVNRAHSDGSGEEGPSVLLAHAWDFASDLTGWWMSEKLDGVRATWDGKAFISRLGNPFYAPDWFVAGLPDHPLDGELWSGRKKFQRTISIVRRQDRSDHWKEISYVVFDAPAFPAPFEDRVAHIKQTLDRSKPPYARAIDHERCQGIDHLRKELQRVEGLGGEGLMLRKPGSAYEAGRSTTLLKVKSFHDAEARVVAHMVGSGKHSGRLGALDVEMPNGIRFHVGTGFSDRQREAPPAVGSVITYRYQELSEAGVPRFPSFVGERIDLPWPPPDAESPRVSHSKTHVHVGPTAPTPGVATPSQLDRQRIIEELHAIRNLLEANQVVKADRRAEALLKTLELP